MSYIGNRVTSTPFIVDVFSGTGAQLAFTPLTFAPAGTAAIAVFVGGSYQSPTSYSLSGTTLTFNSAPAAGTNNIQVLHLGVGATSITVSDGSITTAKIAANAVVTADIADGNVTTAKLATTGVTAGTYGGASNVSVITVGVDGRVTSASNVAFSSGAAISITNDVNTNADTFFPLLSNNVTSGTLAAANTSNTKLFYNANTGTLTATDFNSLSDISLKDNILYIQSPLSVIEKLSGVEFNWKDNGRKSSGFIAQEVEQNLPHLVGSSKEGIKTVNYQGVIAYLVETVKQLNNRIKQLEKKNGIQD